MKPKLIPYILGLFALLAAQPLARAQELQPVESPPTLGTFWLVQKPAPYPFDPFHGQLPIYEVTPGIYLVDDSDVDYSGGDALLSSGGGMMLSSSPTPPGSGGTTNSGFTNICVGPTNFTVSYASSSSNLWLELRVDTNNIGNFVIHTTNTLAFYDVFGTTNMNAYALPVLGKTNWVWLVRSTSAGTNFAWTNITPCEAYFQLGTTLDDDSDGLTSAYENLVSHSSPTNPDTDGDGIFDGVELTYGFDPLVADPPFTISITQPSPAELLQ
jgi:hypothetical protein